MEALRFKTPLPRLARMLTLLGIAVEHDPAQDEPVLGPDGPIALGGGFAFHHTRQVLRRLGLSAEQLDPRTAEGRAWQAILRTMDEAPLMDGAGEPDAEAPMLSGLEGALDVHQALEVRLVQHRVALMQADLPLAMSTWRAFAQVMLHHIMVEDALVTSRYPGFAPPEGWARGAAPFIIDNEHQKIRKWVDEIGPWLARIEAAPVGGPERAVLCLELLDRQKVFHDLLEHHDLRERAFVYPRLEAVLADHEKAEIVGGLLAW